MSFYTVLEADNLDPQMERNCASTLFNRLYQCLHSHHLGDLASLDYLDDEIWDFWADEI